MGGWRSGIKTHFLEEVKPESVLKEGKELIRQREVRNYHLQKHRAVGQLGLGELPCLDRRYET